MRTCNNSCSCCKALRDLYDATSKLAVGIADPPLPDTTCQKCGYTRVGGPECPECGAKNET